MRAAAAASWALDYARTTAGRLRQGADACTLYGVLGLGPEADESQIKAAYRALALQLHPDVNAGNAASARRLSEVNQAYETLSDPRARSAYDHALAWQLAAMKRNYSLLAAAIVVMFVVTLIAVSYMVRWHLQALPVAMAPPGAAAASGARESSPTAAVPARPGHTASLSLPSPADDGPGWTTFRDTRFDFALRYPAGIFARDPAQSDAYVHNFISRDGLATFRIMTARNTARISLARFRSKLLKQRYAGASLHRTPRRRHWFALSGTLGEEAFVERITFSCDGKSMHGWQMRYPLSERATYDKLARQVLRNHPHGNGPDGGCEQAKPKSRTKPRARPRRD